MNTLKMYFETMAVVFSIENAIKIVIITELSLIIYLSCYNNYRLGITIVGKNMLKIEFKTCLTITVV